jgi:hypothetical protein
MTGLPPKISRFHRKSLSNYADVRAHAADIYERVADGSMPCDGAWSAEQIAKFKQWLDEGMAA